MKVAQYEVLGCPVRSAGKRCKKSFRPEGTIEVTAGGTADFRSGMIDHCLVANLAMATAVSGGLTGTTPGTS
jgi:hypothetical protein